MAPGDVDGRAGLTDADRIGSSDRPETRTTTGGTMEGMLDGFGFGLLPSAAAIMFPTMFGEDQQPSAAIGRARRRPSRYRDRVLGYAIRRGRSWWRLARTR